MRNLNLSLRLNENEKLEHYIKKILQLNVLRFWVEGDVIPLGGYNSIFILIYLSDISLLNFSSKWYQNQWNGQRPAQTSTV